MTNHDHNTATADVAEVEILDLPQREEAKTDRRRRAVDPNKPTHYRVVCISLYTRDIEKLEAKVAALKARGYTKANKSWLIRLALGKVDVEKFPKLGPGASDQDDLP